MQLNSGAFGLNAIHADPFNPCISFSFSDSGRKSTNRRTETEKVSESTFSSVAPDLDKDSEALGNIYDHSVCDEGFCADFAELITRASRYNLRDGEKISKKSLVDLCDLMDREACRLYELLRKLEADDVVFNSHAALLPPQPDLDRIIRSESRLSREIEREINLLERRQRARRGYPPPPTIKVDVN